MSKIPYPKSPRVNIDELRAISPIYQLQVLKTLFSIVLFIATYLVVLAFAVLIFFLSLSAAGAILSNLKSFYALLLIAGIVLSAGMFVFFIIKFLFQIKIDTDTSRIELDKEEHPQLFEFVKRVCAETETSFPNKIVISPAVNAAVFYNSSFLNMFLPAKKNLEIGAGLLNCINITEFKAILAHEFGHFSQSSTRLGSYTYTFNKVVHNLLYENEGWLSAINAIASAHAILAIFGQITLWLVRGVMALFVAVYKLINLSYLSLSREMEFHADSVAVSVSGSAPIISALRRLEFGQSVYNYTVQSILNYNEEKTARAQNFFELHYKNLLRLAALNDLPIENGLPDIKEEVYKNRSIEPRLRYKDIWASHPDIEERKKNAYKTEVSSEMLYESPWILFKNPEKIQQELSLRIHELETQNKEIEILPNSSIIEQVIAKESKNKINPIYLDYYTYTSNAFTPVTELSAEELTKLTQYSISEIFNSTAVEMLKRFLQDASDTETLKLISEGHLQVKKFQFDGKQYTRYYSSNLYQELKTDTEKQKQSITDYNVKISNWFYHKALQKNGLEARKYKDLLEFNKKFDRAATGLEELLQELIRFYHEDIVKYNREEDIPYQSKKIKELYHSASKFHKQLKELNSITELEHESESKKELLKASQIEIRNPGKEISLNGFNPLYEDLVKINEKLNQVSIALNQQILQQQDGFLNFLEKDVDVIELN
jgi:Zn-dependent protease with chaperone function